METALNNESKLFIESPEVNPCMYGVMIYKRSSMRDQWEM